MRVHVKIGRERKFFKPYHWYVFSSDRTVLFMDGWSWSRRGAGLAVGLYLDKLDDGRFVG